MLASLLFLVLGLIAGFLTLAVIHVVTALPNVASVPAITFNGVSSVPNVRVGSSLPVIAGVLAVAGLSVIAGVHSFLYVFICVSSVLLLTYLLLLASLLLLDLLLLLLVSLLDYRTTATGLIIFFPVGPSESCISDQRNQISD
jgi:hypothetical protein